MAGHRRNESRDIFERAQCPLAESIVCPFPKITGCDEYKQCPQTGEEILKIKKQKYQQIITIEEN